MIQLVMKEEILILKQKKNKALRVSSAENKAQDRGSGVQIVQQSIQFHFWFLKDHNLILCCVYSLKPKHIIELSSNFPFSILF